MIRTETLVALAVLWPLAGAALVVLLDRWPNAREAATMLTSTSLFALIAGRILPAVSAGGRPRLDLVEVLPGVSLAFEVEPLGMLFALVASGLWIVTSLYAVGYLRGHHEKHQTRFFACFALAIAGALGVAFAANMFTLFVFYEAITISTYPLVTHYAGGKGEKAEQAKQAGRLYLGILMGTSIAFLLLAVIVTHHLAGTTDFTPGGILAGKASDTVLALLLALYVFGAAKAAVMPFHRWLPAAMVAPTPVSALLHAVAVVKAGVFTVLKVAVYIFGLETLRETGASVWLTWAAAITIVLASCIAITKNNLKARLAYSTISQLSYIVLGAALANSFSVVGGGMHIAMHAFGKITLFFCAGAIYVATHKTEVSQLDGLGRRMPFTMLAFFIGSLSVIGVPPAGGSWSKWYLALGAVEGERMVLLALLMMSSLFSIGYLMPVVGRAFLLAPRPEDHEDHDHDHDHGQDHGHGLVEARVPLCVVPPVLTAIGCLVLFFYAEPLYQLLQGMIAP